MVYEAESEGAAKWWEYRSRGYLSELVEGRSVGLGPRGCVSIFLVAGIMLWYMRRRARAQRSGGSTGAGGTCRSLWRAAAWASGLEGALAYSL